jgi:hypothetical protein
MRAWGMRRGEDDAASAMLYRGLEGCQQRVMGLQLDTAGALCLGVKARSAVNRAVFETDDDANERIAPSIDVRDVSVAELAIPKHLSDGGHMNAEDPFFHENVRPDAINKFLLGDDLAGAIGEVDQDIQCSAAKRKH